MNRTALITGITGQDGSFLAEELISKNYKVVGLKRRTSTDNTENIKVLLHPNFQLIEGDLTDAWSINQIINTYKPDEVYNLAAQSHVGTSFKQPEYTFQVNAVGVLNLLEAIRNNCPQCKFLQASTSEMFGSNYDTSEIGIKYQDESTPFKPRSPYAVSKVAAHHLVVNYREAHNIFAVASICFNHECLTKDTPILFRVGPNGPIDIKPISEVITKHATISGISLECDKFSKEVNIPLYIYSDKQWTKVKYVSGFKNINDKYRDVKIVNSRNSVVSASVNHDFIMANKTQKSCVDLEVGDRVHIVDFPSVSSACEDVTIDEAMILGMLVGDGYVHRDIKNIQFTNKNKKILDLFANLWESIGGTSRYYPSKSGFTGEEVGRLDCKIDKNWILQWDLYTDEVDVFGKRMKRVPNSILNSQHCVQEAFLTGYNLCDGLKNNPCVYKFKNFKTNSPILACGLIYLISRVTQQEYNITVEQKQYEDVVQTYYSINLLSDANTAGNQRATILKYKKVKSYLENDLSISKIHEITNYSKSFIHKIKNGYVPSTTHHLSKPKNEVKKIIDLQYNDWLFDIETESHTFCAGVGQGEVHNSERRGELFVSRKITKWVAEFKKFNTQPLSPTVLLKDDNYVYSGELKFPKLRLGNLDAQRDWGYARDYVRAMFLMMQNEHPKDYVISTERARSVRNFLDVAFRYIGIKDWSNYVIIDPEFYRPSDVEYLNGYSTKIREDLNWEPTVSFNDMVKIMIEEDL